MIDLVPISDKGDIRNFLKATIDQYTYDLTESLKLGPEEADRKAQRDLGPMLENGVDAPGHHFFHSRRLDNGETVGATWLVVEAEIRTAWLYYILIFEGHRRQGYGMQTINLLHGKARAFGCDQVSLYVYDHNANAQALYKKIGYRNSAYFMRLPI
jgi:GNAT superfamily N-acetyltransferase